MAEDDGKPAVSHNVPETIDISGFERPHNQEPGIVPMGEEPTENVVHVNLSWRSWVRSSPLRRSQNRSRGLTRTSRLGSGIHHLLCVSRFMSQRQIVETDGRGSITGQVFVVVAAGSVIAFIVRDLGDASLAGWIVQASNVPLKQDVKSQC